MATRLEPAASARSTVSGWLAAKVTAKQTWILVCALMVATLVAVGPTAPPASADLSDGCEAESWIAGTVDLCRGSLVYRDYVYDDYGADQGTPASQAATVTGSFSRPAGDVRYEETPNTADLVDLTLRISGQQLDVSFELNALHEPDSTVAALAIDTDANPATGGGVWGSLPVRSSGWDELHVFDRGDPVTNTIRGRIPLPSGDVWRLQAVTAAAGGPVMNVAFRGPNEKAAANIATMDSGPVGVWFEDLQAAALAAGDISRFGHTVNTSDLRRGITQRASVGPGLHERVYVSDYALPPGEGMTYEGLPGRGDGGTVPALNQAFHYLGRYQPYGIYVPQQQGPHSLQFVFHGSHHNHAGLINQDGMQVDIGERLNRVLVVPLARGPHGFGSDVSERDILDVHADVVANYDIDLNRVFASGYSQGGYIAYRMASLYPHLFAGVISWVGFTGDAGNMPSPESPTGLVTAGAIGNMRDFVGNLRHVPTAMLYGGADELVHLTSAEALAEEFRNRDFAYVFFTHPSADHFTFALLDEWSKEADYTAKLEREPSPDRVVYRTADFLGNASYGIHHDRAYWLTAIQPRTDGYASLDVTSAGCGGSRPVVAKGTGAGDLPVPWISDSHYVVGNQATVADRRITADLRNVADATVNVTETCLAGGSIRYRIITDGKTAVRFTDGRVLNLPFAGTYEGLLP